MKNLWMLLAFVATFSACRTGKTDSDTGTLTVNFVATGSIEGYDHVSKMKVFCDNVEIGESSERKQSVQNKVTVNVPRGSHTIKVTLFAKYDGKWEERTIANEYSFDWSLMQKMNIGSKNTLDITFDIEKEKVVVK